MYQSIYFDRENNKMHLWDDALGYSSFRYNNVVYEATDEKTEFKSIYGYNVKPVRNTFEDESLLEQDVNPEIKTLIQKYSDSDSMPNPLYIGFIDIEVASHGGWKEIRAYNNEILSISLRDYNDHITYQFVLDKNNKFILKTNDTQKFCVVKTEQDLFLKFIQFLKLKQYHILSGWNSENFDFPYIVRRGRKVIGDKINKLSPINIVKDDEQNEDRVHIGGISLLDYMLLYKKFSEGERVSYSLNNIAMAELGRSKLEYQGTLQELYDNDINKFIEYNIEDTLLIDDLEKKLQYMKTAVMLSHKGHIPYEQIFFQSRIIEGAILTSLKRKKLVASNKKENAANSKDLVLGTLENWSELKTKIKVEKSDDGYNVDLSKIDDEYIFKVGLYQWTKEEFQQKLTDEEIQLNTRGGVKNLGSHGEGAYVKEPLKGRYTWIIDLDFTSLYPSIMRSLNISPEAKLGVIENWDPNKLEDLDRFNIKKDDNTPIITIAKDKLFELIKQKNLVISANGVIYDNTKRGIIPEILDEWFAERQKYQKLSKEAYTAGKIDESKVYDLLDYITKILLNSVYGVLLSPSYRFYDKDNGEAVTITGQYLIKYAEKVANKYLQEKFGIIKDFVITMDTDSLLISVADLITNKEDIPTLALELQNHVNDSLTPYVKEIMFLDKHFFSMKQEMIAKSGLFIEKKRYALHVTEKKGRQKDELEIKGIDVVRTNFPLYFRKTLKSIIIQKILDGASKEEIELEIQKLKEGMLQQPITDIMVPTGVKHVDKWFDKDTRYKLRAPIFSKAAINHNLLLKILQLDVSNEPIMDGDKIKYCYLKDNEYQFDTMALKENSPKEILDFIKTYIHYDKIFENQLLSKLENWFLALGWKQKEEKKPKKVLEKQETVKPKAKKQKMIVEGEFW